MKNDDGAFDAARESVDDGRLLDEEFGHVNAERRAGNLQLGVEVRALLRRDLNGAGGEDDADGGFACDGEQFLQGRINTGNRTQGGERATVCRMNVIVLVEIGKLFMRLVRERQAAATTFDCPDIIACL